MSCRTNPQIDQFDFDAERVKRLRELSELSQPEFADEIGVREETVSRWENGRSRPTQWLHVRALRNLCRRLMEEGVTA